jgi:uncharacterized protein YtpQ (UPF0354 family)
VFKSSEEFLKAACKSHYLSLEHLSSEKASLSYEKQSVEVNLLDPDGNKPNDWELRSKIAGVSTGIREKVSRAQTFSDVAGGIFPRVVSAHWCDGFKAVCEDSLMSVPLGDSLRVVFAVEEMFQRTLLGVANVECWGVTEDRVTSAARSNLYSRSTSPLTRFSSPVAYQQFQLGDSYDAGRAFILSDLLWREAQKGMVIGIPSEDLLMIRSEEASSVEEMKAFSALVEEAYRAARTPVSPHPLTYREGQVVVAEI